MPKPVAWRWVLSISMWLAASSVLLSNRLPEPGTSHGTCTTELGVIHCYNVIFCSGQHSPSFPQCIAHTALRSRLPSLDCQDSPQSPLPATSTVGCLRLCPDNIRKLPRMAQRRSPVAKAIGPSFRYDREMIVCKRQTSREATTRPLDMQGAYLQREIRPANRAHFGRAGRH